MFAVAYFSTYSKILRTRRRLESLGCSSLFVMVPQMVVAITLDPGDRVDVITT